jgi:putative molybdopterin biosynthesis protein
MGFDAVIPIENIEALDNKGRITDSIRKTKAIRIRAGVTPWSHIRSMGEDIVQTQLVMPAGQILRPADLGAIAVAGHESVIVAVKPRVAILPTGNELVQLGSELKTGGILEFNSIMLAAQIKDWGGVPTRFPITRDNFKLICNRVARAAKEFDLIILNAGSSAGSEDFSAKVVKQLGILLVHGVAVRPGHPVILGIINIDGNLSGEQKQLSSTRCVPIIGVPGYPVSTMLTSELFMEPLIAKWTGRRSNTYPVTQAILTRKITSPGGDDDYIRVVVGKVGERVLAAPLVRGAGAISSLAHADGIMVLPRGIQGVEAGDTVSVSLYRPESELEKTIFCIGSHDMTLDLLAQFLAGRNRRFSSANVGSMGGLIALNRSEAHLAGSHLLDPETGEYNLAYIQQYINKVPVNLYGFVEREQGLMVETGNPKGIMSLKDLGKPGIRFINRQRGAGTRVLLDYHLAKNKIPESSILGYQQEEFTHLGVAAAVASGRADCGLGIPAAALSLKLDFIPLFHETYQLVIPKVYAESDLLGPLFEVLNDNDFHTMVLNMPGYKVNQMGILMAEIKK